MSERIGLSPESLEAFRAESFFVWLKRSGE